MRIEFLQSFNLGLAYEESAAESDIKCVSVVGRECRVQIREREVYII